MYNVALFIASVQSALWLKYYLYGCVEIVVGRSRCYVNECVFCSVLTRDQRNVAMNLKF